MTIDRANFGHDTTTDEVLSGIDLSGKTVLITGGSSGLGAEAARAMAAQGAKVTITARTLEKGQPVADRINEALGDKIIDVITLELGSLKSVRDCAERYLATHDTLDILINNAGIMACPEAKTEDGFELQFGSNHLGHFVLTGMLAPLLIKAGEGSRIVSLSSAAHHMSPVDFDDVQFENRDYHKWVSYGQSKTANALFAVGLDQRLKDKGVRAFSVHPGVIQTDLMRHMDDDDHKMIGAATDPETGGKPPKSVPAGAATSCYAATAPELDGKGGLYLEDCGIAESNNGPDGRWGVKDYALDPAGAERLWEISEQMVGQKFDF